MMKVALALLHIQLSASAYNEVNNNYVLQTNEWGHRS